MKQYIGHFTFDTLGKKTPPGFTTLYCTATSPEAALSRMKQTLIDKHEVSDFMKDIHLIYLETLIEIKKPTEEPFICHWVAPKKVKKTAFTTHAVTLPHTTDDNASSFGLELEEDGTTAPFISFVEPEDKLDKTKNSND